MAVRANRKSKSKRVLLASGVSATYRKVAQAIAGSQGLTFEKAILDLEGTFAPGQLYVALSRLTSLDGLVLSSPLPERTPGIDNHLKDYISSFENKEELEEAYNRDRIDFLVAMTERAFLFDPMLRDLVDHKKTFNKDENRSLKQKHLPWTNELINNTFPLKEVGEGFIRQVKGILLKQDLFTLAQRMEKATAYFEEKLSELLNIIQKQYRLLKTQPQAKAYRTELQEVKELYSSQLRKIIKLNLLVQHINEGVPLTKKALQKDKKISTVNQAASKDKTSTADISYEMYKEGKSVKVIADERGLVVGTIESHLASFVREGKLEVTDFVKPSRLKNLLKCYDEGLHKSGEIKAVVPDSYTWGEIKMAIAHAEKISAHGE
ncbi:MAG: helix-turn-helix domain-containing protein, partial [Ekhidna sp.]|nr:helix-turn-helix domain-containing protein [Ekhidna sp.]